MDDNGRKVCVFVAIYPRLRIRVGKVIKVAYKSVAGVDCTASISSVTASPIAREVPESAVNGVEEYATVEASVGLVVNIVVPALFRSIVVEFVVPAVPTHTLAQSTRSGSSARWVLLTSEATAPIAPATAKRSSLAWIAVHFREPESIEAIVSPTIVTVVTVEKTEETTYPHFIAEDSVHFTTSPRENVAVWSPVTVKVVFPVRVAVTAVQREEPPDTVHDRSAVRS